MRPELQRLFAEYGASHQDPLNRLTHKVAIPLIVFQVVAMLDWVALFPLPAMGVALTLGHVAFAAAIGWYLWMDPKLGLILAVLIGACFPLGWHTPWLWVVAIAIFGWAIQLAGHAVFEKKSPSFFRNLIHALVGPAFFVATAIGVWPSRGAPDPAKPAAR